MVKRELSQLLQMSRLLPRFNNRTLLRRLLLLPKQRHHRLSNKCRHRLKLMSRLRHKLRLRRRHKLKHRHKLKPRLKLKLRLRLRQVLKHKLKLRPRLKLRLRLRPKLKQLPLKSQEEKLMCKLLPLPTLIRPLLLPQLLHNFYQKTNHLIK